MNVDMPHPLRSAPRGRVIALHCSGAGAGQWCALTEALEDAYDVDAPEQYGCESTGMWSGAHAFTLDDEAQGAIALIDSRQGKVHLVGHSYGGAVALNVALSRPDRIASMALYEPAAAHLLRQMGAPGGLAYAEIADLADRVSQGVLNGDYRRAAAAFVDYWNGPGAWEEMRPVAQQALIQWVPKGVLEFRAVMQEAMPADAYRALKFPVLMLRGAHAPKPTRLIAERLGGVLPRVRLMVIEGAGHMGPLTQAAEVSAVIRQHILDAEDRCTATRARPTLLGPPTNSPFFLELPIEQGAVMGRRYTGWHYKTMSAEDRRTFDRWLKVNAAA